MVKVWSKTLPAQEKKNDQLAELDIFKQMRLKEIFQ